MITLFNEAKGQYCEFRTYVVFVYYDFYVVWGGGFFIDYDEWVAVAPAVYVWVKVTDEFPVYVDFGCGCVYFS